MKKNQEEIYHLEGFNWGRVVPGEPTCINGCVVTDNTSNKSLMIEIDKEILKELASLEYHIPNKKSYFMFFKSQNKHNFNILQKIKRNAEEILRIYNFNKDFELLSITPRILGEDVEFIVDLIMDEDLPEYLKYKKII